ncbi:MAG: Ion channel protein [Desulfobulbaceae bacterium]|nr:Ion channel protein [Desulfobulbaceae bacterium]
MMQQVIWNRLGFHNLLFWIFVYLVVNPFLSTLPYYRYVVQLLFSLVLFFALFAIHKEKKLFPISIGLLVLTLLCHWADILGVVEFSQPVNYWIMVIYLGTVMYSFSAVIVTAKMVSLRLISATLCLYLIIGVFWGALYALLESLVPGSFSGGMLERADSADQVLQSFVYFSFITLTTLGYGDITPQTLGAGGICQVEAVLGQFYTAVLVAYLVGMYSSERKTKKEKVMK